jgi:hypothetical protein
MSEPAPVSNDPWLGRVEEAVRRQWPDASVESFGWSGPKPGIRFDLEGPNGMGRIVVWLSKEVELEATDSAKKNLAYHEYIERLDLGRLNWYLAKVGQVLGRSTAFSVDPLDHEL